jgi:hypothetical protein
VTALRVNLTAFDRLAVAVAAVSAGTLLLELTWPHELEAPASVERATAPIEPVLDVAAIGPLSDYLSVSERPLFTHDRRPFVMIVEEAAPAPVRSRVEFELTAVIITSATQLALLRSNLTPTVQRVALNQAIDGWTLAAVTPDSVLLTQRETTVTVPLRPNLGGARSAHAVRIDPATARN